VAGLARQKKDVQKESSKTLPWLCGHTSGWIYFFRDEPVWRFYL